MDASIEQAIAEKKCPGGVLWFERADQVYHKAFGQRAVVPANEAMTEDTIFDAASLTKVVACTPAVMLLVERGKIDVEEKVTQYLPEFTGGGKEAITIRHLLTHTSGLRPGIETKSDWQGISGAIQKACAEKVQTEPGAVVRYSDINFFVLGEVVRRVSGRPLEEFVSIEVFQPLKMVDTGYLPPKQKIGRIAPTEVVQGQPLRGVVHDPTSRKMGGVAGHAGLFFTAADLARFARMLLNGGELEGVRVFKPETVRRMLEVSTPPGIPSRRGLGWDIDSSYSGPRGKFFPIGSYGHTGWTGTSLWIDPFSGGFLIFLSNRNHPDENGSVLRLRNKLGTLAAEAIPDFNFTYVPGALAPRAEEASAARKYKDVRVLNGVDVLVRENFAPLKGKRVGLITNHTGQDRQRRSLIDLMSAATNLTLVALFSPEHGIRGVLDEKIGDSQDEKTGLPIHSLYGETRKPTPEQLKGIDCLVYDIQDVGCRFYTYTSTMGLGLEAAAAAGIPFFVLDRINPITGNLVDGPVLSGNTSFVGFHKIPLRYGMTIGELAKMFNEERQTRADLHIIQVQGWTRDLWFDQTGQPWANPSPNMRTLAQATLYPGVGLLESALSVGRGTDTPFEVIGAPYIEDVRLAEELNKAGLPGVRFYPVRFTPVASVHKDKVCGGVQIVLTDREACDVVDVGLLIARVLYRWYPEEFNPDKIKHLLLHPPTLEAIKADQPISDIRAAWKADLEEFQKRRAKYLIY